MHSTLVATTSGSASSFLIHELSRYVLLRLYCRLFFRREKHIPSSFIRKEDAEPEVVATRVECISG
jgi:hypothetical protein